MRKVLHASLFLLLVCFAAFSQQTPAQPQSLTFYYDYTVNPGKEDEFMNLIKLVGAPVRDKLMAEGVIQAWGMETPILRQPGGTTNLIWFSVANMGDVEKVLTAMEAQQAKLEAEAKASKSKTPSERIRETVDMSKTRDWLTIDLVSGFSSPQPAPGVLPVTRYNFVKAKPGKGNDYRRTWEKYNKPVFDKLVADGVILAFGLSTEAVRTEGNFTHYVWMATTNMGGLDKIAAAFAADRARRTEDERNSITQAFNDATEPDMARSIVTRSRIFHLPPPKKQ